MSGLSPLYILFIYPDRTLHFLPPTIIALYLFFPFSASPIFISPSLYLSPSYPRTSFIYLIPSHSQSYSFIFPSLHCVFYMLLLTTPIAPQPLSLPKLHPTFPTDLSPSFSFHLLSHPSSSFPSNLSFI